MDSVNKKDYEPGKAPFIYGMMPGLTERGKIKIGKKGDSRPASGGGTWQQPIKLDHFLITTLERDATGNFKKDDTLYQALNLQENIKRLPIMLLFDDISMVFQYRYTCYTGKTLFCSGDGQFAHQIKSPEKPERSQVTCPCYRKDPTYQGKDKCKINGKLSCVIDGANVIGGVWVYRTTGYNSTVGIISSLSLIKTMTGGILAGIPLVLTVQPKVATNPVDGKSQTIQVVGIEYAGTLGDLQNGALKLAQKNAEYRARLQHVEKEVRALISVDADVEDQAGDIRDEFFPEDATLVKPEPITQPSETAEASEQTPVQTEIPEKKPAQTEQKPEAPATAPAQRTRRTKAQIEADKAAQGSVQPSAAPTASAAQEPATAALTQPAEALDFELF